MLSLSLAPAGMWTTMPVTERIAMPVSLAPTPAELDPVTFQPYPEDAAPVELGLTYDSTPSGFVRAGWGIPAWLLLLGGAAVAVNYLGGRI